MSEIAAVAEYLELRRSELWPVSGAPDGRGRAALLIGGFGVTPRSLGPLAGWLRGAGWTVRVAGLGWNTACGTHSVAAVVDAAADLAAAHGPVTLIGHSRGGVLGRVASARAPDLVASLVTVCTPWSIGPPDRPGVASMARLVRTVRRTGLDVLGSIECADGPCCTDFREEMVEVPACPWTVIRSTADQIAGDLARTDWATREIVTSTSHLGGVLSVPGWRAIAAAIG